MTIDIPSPLRPVGRLALAGAVLTLAACASTKPPEKSISPSVAKMDTATSDGEKTPKLTFDALSVDYKAEPFNPAELRSLLRNPRSNPRRLMWLINHAGAERDLRFRSMLERKDLRADPALDLALHGYDYSVNGNRQALESILKDLATEPVGSDAQAVVTLSFIDDWKVTTDAVRKHFVRTDAAGSLSQSAFWLRREQLFPQNYRAFKQQG